MGSRHIVVLMAIALAVAFVVMRTGSRPPEPEPVAAAKPAPQPTVSPESFATPRSDQPAALPTPSPSRVGAVPRPEPEASVKKLETLKSILEARNDNDPRLDTDFRDLDPATKAKLQDFYRELPVEKLNSRGTVVFLLGRNIRTSDDARFFNQVLREPPCLSLANCSRAGVADPEASSDVTLAYPQIVATVGLVKSWGAITDPTRREELLQSLKEAARSSNPALVRAARAALDSIQKGQN